MCSIVRRNGCVARACARGNATFSGVQKNTNTKRKRLQEIRDDWLFVAGFRQIKNDVELRRVNRLESKKKKVQNIIYTNAESFFYRNVRSTRNPQQLCARAYKYSRPPMVFFFFSWFFFRFCFYFLIFFLTKSSFVFVYYVHTHTGP